MINEKRCKYQHQKSLRYYDEIIAERNRGIILFFQQYHNCHNRINCQREHLINYIISLITYLGSTPKPTGVISSPKLV